MTVVTVVVRAVVAAAAAAVHTGEDHAFLVVVFTQYLVIT